MTLTESQRKAKNKWDAANMTSISIKIKKEYADSIRAACVADNIRVSDIIYKALSDYMNKRGTPLPARKQAHEKKE